jgi:hypothetical protein
LDAPGSGADGTVFFKNIFLFFFLISYAIKGTKLVEWGWKIDNNSSPS